MFIKSLLIFFLFMTALRLILPPLLRWAVAAFLRRQMRNGSVLFGPNGAPFGPLPEPERPAGPSASDGRVRVDYVPPTTKRQPKTEFRGGDYVEFEEVK